MYSICLPVQVIIYVDDANDELPVFTQQQYNRLGLRETAGIGTSVIVVRATDPDTGESSEPISVLVGDSIRFYPPDCIHIAPLKSTNSSRRFSAH